MKSKLYKKLTNLHSKYIEVSSQIYGDKNLNPRLLKKISKMYRHKMRHRRYHDWQVEFQRKTAMSILEYHKELFRELAKN